MRKAKRGSDATRSFRKNKKAGKMDPAVKPTKTAANFYREQDTVVSGYLYGEPIGVWTRLSDEKSYLSRSFRKNRKARKIDPAVKSTKTAAISYREQDAVVSGSLYDPNVWTRLSDQHKSYLSKSVTSITLTNGDTTLFSCSGIAIDCEGNHRTRILTSASLVRALNGITKDHFDVKIEVHHEGNEVYMGFLAEFDLDHNLAVVNVYNFPNVHVGLQHVLEIPHGDVSLVVLGRDISGKLITRTVMVSGGFRACEDDEDFACKISEVWEGGPLFSLDGNFVGMNLFLTPRRAFFLPWKTIFKHLKQQVTLAYRFRARPIGAKSNSHLEVHGGLNQEQLDSMGYPKLPSTMLGASMILVNTFEDTFGDTHGEGVWSKFSKKASSNLNGSVVALASFNGEQRFFACTGFFIEWNGYTFILTSASLVRIENKIVENLKIQVKFPGNKCRKGEVREGELEYHSLPYNIAVVSATSYHARPVNALVHWKSSLEVVASVGCVFESGALMATTGKLVPWSGTLDCDYLTRSSCKITKAGIGGPVVTLDGDVIGMNFYDTRVGTPFLSWECICNILESFKGKSKVGEVGNVSVSCGASFCKTDMADKDLLNRWPVPMPYWRPRDYVDEDRSDDDGDDFEYTYHNGVKYTLF